MTQRGRAAGRPTTGRRTEGRPRQDLAGRRQRLRSVIEPVLDGVGYDLEDLSVVRAGRRHVVRVIVDGDGGISLDAVADVSRAVSAAIDRAEEADGDLIAGEYQLEVSSPGVDRPLTLPRHWRRNVGRLVKVTVRGAGLDPTAAPGQRHPDPAGGDRQLVGRVVAADDDRVVIEATDRTAAWAYPDLGPGRVQVEFNRLDEAVDDDPGETDGGSPDDAAGLDDEFAIDDEEDVEGEER